MFSYGSVSQSQSQNLDAVCKNLGLAQSILWHVLLLQPTIHHSTTGQLSPTYLCLCDTSSHITVLPVAS